MFPKGKLFCWKGQDRAATKLLGKLRTEPIPGNLIKVPAFNEGLYQLISKQPFQPEVLWTAKISNGLDTRDTQNQKKNTPSSKHTVHM